MIFQVDKNRNFPLLSIVAVFVIVTALSSSVAQAAGGSYWSLDENAGSLAKDSISNNDASISGSVWSSGQSWSALSFDGSDDFLSVNAATNLNNLESLDLELWIKPSSLGENNQGWIISKAKSGGALPSYGWVLRLNNSPANSLLFAVDHANSHLEVITGKNTIILNEWNKVNLKWTGENTASGVKIFVNDKEVAYYNKEDGYGTRADDALYKLLIGSDPAKNRSFAGLMDEVSINRTNIITPTTTPEVTSVYKAGTEVQTIDNLNVRDGAGLSSLNLGIQSQGSVGTVLADKPVALDNYTWIKVDFNSGVDGWVADSFLKAYTTQTPTTTPTTTSGIWKPKPFTTWQWQLTGTVDTTINADMFDIDMFDTPVETITALHNKGSKVICYFSAGSYEDWRPDAKDFPTSVLGKNNGWPGEKWLDIRNITALAPIMEKRLDLAVQKGCDGVEPDNIDGYTNSTGFSLTGAHQITYNKWLAQAAHDRGLSIGLKNDIDQVVQLEPYFDWALNEQCHEYNECNTLSPFINKDKAVFITEYRLATSNFCPSANANGFMAMKKKLSLDAYREVCWR